MLIGYNLQWIDTPLQSIILIGGNIISQKSKKQDVVARSSAKAEYRAMGSLTCEFVWVKQFFKNKIFVKSKK